MRKHQNTILDVTIEKLSHEGRGLTSVDGKRVFVQDALPGETVRIQYSKRHRQYDEAFAVEILTPAAERVTPACPQFGRCGGCVLQHADPAFQRLHKEAVLFEQLAFIGQVEPTTRLPALSANDYGYRGRARLGVRVIPKTNELVVGFRERNGRYLTRSSCCPILDERVGNKIQALQQMCDRLSIRAHLPQIEVIATTSRVGLIFRVLQTPTADDKAILRAFGETERFCIEIEPNKPETIYRLTPDNSTPYYSYSLADDLTFDFLPGDFTQVNHAINTLMVQRVCDLLTLTSDDHVLELFAGLGNFTLPLAKRAGKVTAVEGSADLVTRGTANAKKNHLANIDFHVANLFEAPEQHAWWQAKYSALLLDPPRLGAEAVCRAIHHLKVPCIIYISCHPATLARDAQILVHEQGYSLHSAGMMDMFPHTSHVEAMAVFIK